MSLKDPQEYKDYYDRWNKEYYEKNKEKIINRSREWYKVNKQRVREEAKLRHRNDIRKTMISNSKQRSKKLNLPHNIELEDLTIPEFCSILGIQLKVGDDSSKPYSPSLDRIDSGLGYIKGNIQIISHLANTMKSSATPEQLIKFADWIYKTYGKENKTSQEEEVENTRYQR